MHYLDVMSHTERIKCNECGLEQDAEVEHTYPFPTYVHVCEDCGFIVMESDWDKIDAHCAMNGGDDGNQDR